MRIKLSGSHDIEGLADDGNSDERQHYSDYHVALHNLIITELAHSGTSIIYGG